MLMISFTKIIVIIWILTGLAGLIWGIKALHNPENKQKLKEYIEDFANEVEVTEEDFLCMLHIAFFVTGFLGVILVFYRRVRSYIRSKWNV